MKIDNMRFERETHKMHDGSSRDNLCIYENGELVAKGDNVMPEENFAYCKYKGLLFSAYKASKHFGEAWVFVSVQDIKNFVGCDTNAPATISDELKHEE